MALLPVTLLANVPVPSGAALAAPVRGARALRPAPRAVDAADFKPAYDVAKLVERVEAAPPDLLAVRELFAFCRRKNLNDADDWERSENLLMIAEQILKDPPRVCGVVRESAVNEMRLQLAVRALRAYKAMREGYVYRDVAWGLHRALKKRLHLFHRRFSRDPVAEFAVYEALSVLGKFTDTETTLTRALRKTKDAALLLAAIASSVMPVFAVGKVSGVFNPASTALGNAAGASGMVALDLIRDLFARRPRPAHWWPFYDDMRHRMTYLTKTTGTEHDRLEIALARELQQYHPDMPRIWGRHHRGLPRHRHAFFLGLQNIVERFVREVHDPNLLIPCMPAQQAMLAGHDKALRERTMEVLLTFRQRCRDEGSKNNVRPGWRTLLVTTEKLLRIAKDVEGFKDAQGRWTARAELNALLSSNLKGDTTPKPPPPVVPAARPWG